MEGYDLFLHILALLIIFGLDIEHMLVQSVVGIKSFIIFIVIFAVNIYILHLTVAMDCPTTQQFHALPLMIQPKELGLIKSKSKIF